MIRMTDTVAEQISTNLATGTNTTVRSEAVNMFVSKGNILIFSIISSY